MTKTWEQMTADEKANELRAQLDNIVQQQNQINLNLASRVDILMKAANAAKSDT